MTNKILDAVKQLDAKNDNHWTADGLPRLETVRMLASDTSLSREQVNDAAKDYNRAAAIAAVSEPPAPPPVQPGSVPVAPTPTAGSPPAGAEAPPLDSGVRGELGPETPPVAPLAPGTPQLDQSGGPVPPENVLGEALPQPDPLPTAPAADGLPTAREPTAIEGAIPTTGGLTVEDVSAEHGPGGSPIPQISQGTTTQGFNAMNSLEDDLRDAKASVAPSPNAPTTLGGPLEPHEVEGINADGLSAAADATGEAQLYSLDRGSPGNPDALPELEAALEAATQKSEKLRSKHDDLTAQMNEAASNESRIRAAIEAATPRTGHMEAVQGYFAAQDAKAQDTLIARQAIVESGVNLAQLGRLTQRSPLDAAAKS